MEQGREMVARSQQLVWYVGLSFGAFILLIFFLAWLFSGSAEAWERKKARIWWEEKERRDREGR